jgi:hypothetical protein
MRPGMIAGLRVVGSQVRSTAVAGTSPALALGGGPKPLFRLALAKLCAPRCLEVFPLEPLLK